MLDNVISPEYQSPLNKLSISNLFFFETGQDILQTIREMSNSGGSSFLLEGTAHLLDLIDSELSH